tara:strand:+ start:1231 stop:1377 length:147 start_codon:yes stop_codon:yes gene_type:complete
MGCQITVYVCNFQPLAKILGSTDLDKISAFVGLSKPTAKAYYAAKPLK